MCTKTCTHIPLTYRTHLTCTTVRAVLCVQVCTRANLYTSTCTCMLVNTHIHVHTHQQNTQRHTHTHTHTHTTHTHTHREDTCTGMAKTQHPLPSPQHLPSLNPNKVKNYTPPFLPQKLPHGHTCTVYVHSRSHTHTTSCHKLRMNQQQMVRGHEEEGGGVIMGCRCVVEVWCTWP